jgi:hypothetical protein
LKVPKRRKKDVHNAPTLKDIFGGDDVAEVVEEVEVADEEEVDETEDTSRYYNPRSRKWVTRAKKKTSGGLATKDKYDDNKGRSIKCMDLLAPSLTMDVTVAELVKDPNIADAVLQGVWVLWQEHAPRAPTRRKAAAPKPPKTKKQKPELVVF